MAKVKWNDEAIDDINEIAEFIAADSETFAKIQVQRFFGRIEILADNPLAGRTVPELNNKKVRQLVEGNYRIIYEVKAINEIEILCVIHSMRLLKKHPTFKGKTKS